MKCRVPVWQLKCSNLLSSFKFQFFHFSLLSTASHLYVHNIYIKIKLYFKKSCVWNVCIEIVIDINEIMKHNWCLNVVCKYLVLVSFNILLASRAKYQPICAPFILLRNCGSICLKAEVRLEITECV